MKGRKVGSVDISIAELNKITEMTVANKYSRKEIAKAVGRSINTVWRYQTKLGLI